MNFEGGDREDKIINQVEAALNGDAEKVSTSRFTSLLASKDRDYLLSPTGSQVKVSDLEGHVVGLYFSANWYSPCRNFNRVLSNAYEQLKTNRSNFEVVFVSADEDLSAFSSYYSSMPWLTIPFSDLESKKALSRKFDVEDIPCLIILQPDGTKEEEVLHNGVELVHRYGVEAFPFTRERLEQLEREEKEKHENQTITNLLSSDDRDYLLGRHSTTGQVPVASLVGKTLGLFFSAQWCLPGMKFTPKLTSIYHKIKHAISQRPGVEDFEIVYVSSDRDRASFDSYFALMPWLALPFGDPNIRALTRHFDVQSIPCLVILGPDGKTVTKHGRSLINLYQENAYPFTEARLASLHRQMDEEAKGLPKSEFHAGHHHELTLVSDCTSGGPFICCDCDEQGSGWAYQCLECGYEVHTKCVRAVGGALTVGP
ncbi:probable nucleoredoxin 2 [Syzygium oleosum]|uniref:probable nucleoredoxin 2 n=1 Tax=Syzygium oleosum TaxID=219896 RepID=UPI0011D25069|nr:probable nucleoredoxin 2 [Syzygium oleosum]